MKNREIRIAKQKLYEILNKECKNEVERWDQLVALAQERNAPIPPGKHTEHPRDSINTIAENIHTVLQTQMMFNACMSAKTSSIAAAVAAGLALVTVVLAIITICSN